MEIIITQRLISKTKFVHTMKMDEDRFCNFQVHAILKALPAHLQQMQEKKDKEKEKEKEKDGAEKEKPKN